MKNPARKAASEIRARERGSRRCWKRRINVEEKIEMAEICWEMAQAWRVIDQ